MILTPLQKLPKNVGDFGKFIVALNGCPKSNKSPNLVTLATSRIFAIVPPQKVQKIFQGKEERSITSATYSSVVWLIS